jgi:hypothetical protein
VIPSWEFPALPTPDRRPIRNKPRGLPRLLAAVSV